MTHPARVGSRRAPSRPLGETLIPAFLSPARARAGARLRVRLVPPAQMVRRFLVYNIAYANGRDAYALLYAAEKAYQSDHLDRGSLASRVDGRGDRHVPSAAGPSLLH